MSKEFYILERRDLEKGGVVALPGEFYDPEVADVFSVAGKVEGINSKDFKHHEDWNMDVLPLKPQSSFEAPTRKEVDDLRQKLHSLSSYFDLKSFDLKKLANTREEIDRILDFQMLAGDLFLLRFDGREIKKNRPTVRSNLYFVGPREPEPTFEAERLKFGDMGFVIDGDLGRAMRSVNYEGEISFQKVGYAKLHRRMLKPYQSKGKFGEPYSNGPWVVLQDKPFLESTLRTMKGKLEERAR